MYHSESKLNDATQQQNYEWTVSTDTTTEPFLQILISFASVAPPADTGGTWTDEIDDSSILEIRNDDSPGQASTIIPKIETPSDPTASALSVTAFMRRGILLHFGEYGVTDIPLMNLTDPDDTALRFPFTTVGLVRDLYSETTEDPNTSFDAEKQDISIYLDEDGECTIQKVTGKTRAVSELLKITQAQMTTILGLDGTAADYVSKRIRLLTTFVGVSDRIVVQIQVSSDFGGSYANVADGTAGIITTNTYAGQTFPSILFTGENLFATINAPYIPTLNIESGVPGFPDATPKTNGNPDLDTSGVTFTAGNGDNLQVIDFTAPNVFRVELRDSGAGLLNTFTLTGKLQKGEDRNVFDFVADPPSTATGTFTYDPDNDEFEQQISGGGSRIFSVSEKLNYIRSDVQYLVSGVFNPYQRDTVVQANLQGKTKTKYLLDLEASSHDADTTPGVAVASDLSKGCLLFLRKLIQSDISASGNKITQAEVDDPSLSGNIGSTIGSARNFTVTPPSTGAEVFRSDRSIQRAAKETFLHVSIPELSGVRSYEGSRSDIGKTIAVIPREDLMVENDDERANRFSFNAPFENWVKIRNAKELYLNQLSCEIRSPDGKLIEGMLPSTTLVVKIRESPDEMEKKKSSGLVRALVDTGLILSRNISSVSS